MLYNLAHCLDVLIGKRQITCNLLDIKFPLLVLFPACFVQGGIFVPLNELAVPERVVGEREVQRAMDKGILRKLFVAADSDVKVTKPVRDTAAGLSVEVEEVDSKLKLGRACAIDRPAAVAGLLKK